MPSLALMTQDETLYREVAAALEDSDWSVERFDGSAAPVRPVPEDVVGLDASHPEAASWAAQVAKPLLVFVDQGTFADVDELAGDIVFRPARGGELLARLDRLRAGAPLRKRLKTMEFLESLIEASVDAIIATDLEQRVVLFNPSAERISGRHADDVLGQLALENLLGRASAELVGRRLFSQEHGGEGRLEPTMLDLLDIHGQRIPVQLSASLIHERGAPSAIMLIVSDLRDRIRVEERLSQAQKKLAFTEKQGVLAELAGTAAHELNQPLTSMMAYAELLLRQSKPDSAGWKAAKVLIREAERMAEIVKKIGKITRYETTSYVGQQKIFDLDRAADPADEQGDES